MHDFRSFVCHLPHIFPSSCYCQQKLTGTWFSDTRRAIAITIGIITDPLGVLMANMNNEHLQIRVLSLAAMRIATFEVERSESEIPSIFSASEPEMNFVSEMKIHYFIDVYEWRNRDVQLPLHSYD
ncbi:unnamed protein product [Caenorhabditis brenneri]